VGQHSVNADLAHNSTSAADAAPMADRFLHLLR